jgi:WhiB family transcriptional regulator, redox-sensing transcriptional regulator
MIRSPRVAGHATWRDTAACRHHDPELFFPIAAAGPALDQAEQAKRVCQPCPAREPCLRWALDRGVAFGIWGGTTEDERRAMRDAARGGGTTIPRVRPGGAGSR